MADKTVTGLSVGFRPLPERTPELVQQEFDHKGARTKDTFPDLPDYEDHYRALQEIYWYLYDQAEENLRVFDDPAGEA